MRGQLLDHVHSPVNLLYNNNDNNDDNNNNNNNNSKFIIYSILVSISPKSLK